MSKKEIHVIIFLVEGDTEVEFYGKVRQLLLQQYSNNNYEFLKPINIKGIGNYKSNASRQFANEMNKFLKSNALKDNCKQKKSKKIENNVEFIFHAFMCIDTDVLGSTTKPAKFKQNPPINEYETKKSIEVKNGIPHFIKAIKCIEDWFLEDTNGIVKYLKLSKMPKLNNNKSGAENLKDVFAKGNKLYTKGAKSVGFIDCLDISMILQNHTDDFQELINLIK